MVPRWLPGSLFASLAVLVFASSANAGSTHASSTITVRPSTFLQLAGSNVICTVEQSSGTTGVACFHNLGTIKAAAPKGYTIVGLDVGVFIEPPGSTKPTKAERQPSFAADALIKGGKAHSSVVKLSLNDAALISGTHMAVVVEKAQGGGNAIGVVYLDAKENLIVGSYTIGISNQSVTIVKLTGASASKVVYRHSVY